MMRKKIKVVKMERRRQDGQRLDMLKQSGDRRTNGQRKWRWVKIEISGDKAAG